MTQWFMMRERWDVSHKEHFLPLAVTMKTRLHTVDYMIHSDQLIQIICPQWGTVVDLLMHCVLALLIFNLLKRFYCTSLSNICFSECRQSGKYDAAGFCHGGSSAQCPNLGKQKKKKNKLGCLIVLEKQNAFTVSTLSFYPYLLHSFCFKNKTPFGYNI